MKTLNPTNLIAVEVPKDAICWIAKGHSSNYYLYYNLNDEEEEYSKKLEGNFQILGEVTDAEISFDVELPNKNYVGRTVYKDFNNPESGFFDSKEESFRSLLSSNGLFFENPMGKINIEDYAWGDVNIGVYRAGLEKWQSFESKLIKGKLIILKQK